jgi:hypothetical protein
MKASVETEAVMSGEGILLQITRKILLTTKSLSETLN